MNDTPNTHLGKKILYGLVITLCCLTLILSVAGIIGAWVVQNTVGNAAVAALKVVETTTHTVRLSTGKVDNRLTNLYDRTNGIVEATQQLGQSASDKGLVMTLLPEEKEQQLVETVSSLKETFADLRASLVNGLELYRRIERMPFVNLPGLNEGQMEKIESSLAKIQGLFYTLGTAIADLRAGVAGAIGKVESAASLVLTEIVQLRETIADLDSKLAALEALSVRLQQVIPLILMVLALLMTLLLAWVIYTQVEVILLYRARWKLLGQPQAAPLAEAPVLPSEFDEPGL